jgi:hypothetical protein
VAITHSQTNLSFLMSGRALLAILAAALTVTGYSSTLRGTPCALAGFEAYKKLDLSPLCDESAWVAPVSHAGRSLQAGEHVITGVAQTFAEDHFKTNQHFMFTVVKTTDGRQVVVDVPKGQRYSGSVVRWIVRDKTEEEKRQSLKPGQQIFPPT